MENKKNDKMIFGGLIVLFIVVIGVAFFFLYLQYAASNTQTAGQNNNQQNTQSNAIADWNTVSNNEFGFSLKYPNGFFDAGHEPKILTGDCNYQVFPDACPNINGLVSQDSQVNVSPSTLTVNNTPYCLYDVADAATGHIYHYYYYTTVKNQKCIVATFDTSATNCDFYLPLEQGNAEQEKNYNDCIVKNQNQPVILNQIINTFTPTN